MPVSDHPAVDMIASKGTHFFFAALSDARECCGQKKITVSVPACESTVFAHLPIVSVDTPLYGFWKPCNEQLGLLTLKLFQSELIISTLLSRCKHKAYELEHKL